MSTKQDVVDYVMHSPSNTNESVLTSLLSDLEELAQHYQHQHTVKFTMNGRQQELIFITNFGMFIDSYMALENACKSADLASIVAVGGADNSGKVKGFRCTGLGYYDDEDMAYGAMQWVGWNYETGELIAHMEWRENGELNFTQLVLTEDLTITDVVMPL